MKEINKDELLKELKDIHENAIKFFNKAAEESKGDTFSVFEGGRVERDEFWDKLTEPLQDIATDLISKIINIAPLLAESARMTSYLSQGDQIEFGHSIKGMRSALRLCRYRYWEPEVLHDEGTVLGVQPAGQSDDQGIRPKEALPIFEDCFQRVEGMVELVDPVTVKRAEQEIEKRGQLSSGFEPDTAFIMMWLDPKQPKLEDVYNTVKRCFNKFGITAERADDIEHEGLITEKIIEKIKKSEFLYADLTGARPSVYYEVGFAHAITKRVILFRDKGEKIHFDLAGYNCPEYKNLSDLEKRLMKRLSHMTGRKVKE